jgi:hypothetical protein
MEIETILAIIGYVLIISAATAEAIMDKIQFHYDSSIFSNPKLKQNFWNPALSWVNKWKDGSAREERFLGSSTIFVFTTDAWHLFKFVRNTALFIGLPLLSFGPNHLIIEMIIARIMYGITFTLYFDKILIKK